MLFFVGVEAGLHDGDRLARAGHLTQAASVYSRLIESGTQLEQALIRRGRIFRDTFRYQQAEADFRRALDLNPLAEEALKQLGWILQETKRTEEALAVFSTLLAVGTPANRTWAMAKRGQLLRSVWRYAAAARQQAPLAATGQNNLVRRYAKALRELAAERAAAKACIARLRADPGSDEDLLKSAEHLLKAGWPKLALRLIDKVRDRNGYAGRMLTVHFFAAWQIQSVSAGLAALTDYAGLVQTSQRQYAYCLALAWLQMDRADDAVAVLLTVQERDDTNADLLQRAIVVSNADAESRVALFGSLLDSDKTVVSASGYLSALVAAAKLPVAFDIGGARPDGFPGPVRPRILVQFWDASPPEEIRALTSEWAARNPGWLHLLFSEEQARGFIHSHFGRRFVALFDFCHHAAMKADFFRLCYLYASGGVYVDADERCVMPADTFFDGWEDAPFVASISNNLAVYVHNWFLCSRPGHPVVRMAIDLMMAGLEAAREAGQRPHIWRTTGPGCMTRAVALHCRQSEAACGRAPDDLVLIGSGHFRHFAKMPELVYKMQQHGDRRLAQEPRCAQDFSTIRFGRHGTAVPSPMTQDGDTLAGREAFRRHYEEESSAWGRQSGGGSHPYYTIEYRAFLDKFTRMNNIRSIVDIGCGDWQFSRFLNLDGIDYCGLDVVPRLVERNAEIYGSRMVRFSLMPENIADAPGGDLLLMKDVLQHLPNQDIFAFREKVFPKFKFCLLTNSFAKLNTRQNTEIAHGAFRCLDLASAPYAFPGCYLMEFASVHWERIRTFLYQERR